MTVTREDLDAGRVDFSDIAEPGAVLLPPVHPGDVLRDWLAELGMTANALAKAIRVPHNRITAILAGQRAVTADTALRLARYLGTSPDLWLGLQLDYDREVAERKLGERIAREVTPRAA
jgi:addiction module HigA family antidote